MAANKVAIENVVPIYDPAIKGCDLGKQYKGYEISNTGILRSMKFFKAYPFGILINPDRNGMYELSDYCNRRVKLTMGDIMNLCKGRPYNIETSYTCMHSSRNNIIGSKSEYLTRKSAPNKLQEVAKNTPCPLQIGGTN